MAGAQDERYHATLELIEREAPTRPEAHNRARIVELDARIFELKDGRTTPLPAFIRHVFQSTEDACHEAYGDDELDRLPFGCAPTDWRAFAKAAEEFADQERPDRDFRAQTAAEAVYLQAVDDGTSERELARSDDE